MNSFILPEFSGFDPVVLADPALSTRLPHLARSEGDPYTVPIGVRDDSIVGLTRPQIIPQPDGSVRFGLEGDSPFLVHIASILALAEDVDLLDIGRAGLIAGDRFNTPQIGAITMRLSGVDGWHVSVIPHKEGVKFTDPQLLAARGLVVGYARRSLAKRKERT